MSCGRAVDLMRRQTLKNELQQSQHQTTCKPKWEPLRVKEIVLKLTRGQAVHVAWIMHACWPPAPRPLLCPPAAAPAGARWARRCCCPRVGERRQQPRLPGTSRGGWTQSFGSKVSNALILNKLAANPTYFWSSFSLNILRVCSGSEVSTESGAVGEVSSFISLFYNLLLQFQGRQIDGITTV